MSDDAPYQPPETDPEPAATPPAGGPWHGPLWRAYPLGLGAVLAGFCLLYGIALVGGTAWVAIVGSESDAQLRAALIVLVSVAPVLIAGGVFGISTQRGQGWSRYPMVGLGLFLAGSQVLISNMGQAPHWLAVGIGFGCLLLASPRFEPWYDADQRGQLHPPQNAACAAVYGWLAAWLALSPITLRFQEIFDSIGVELPLVTQLTLAAAHFVAYYPFLVYPAALTLPLLLLRVPTEAAPRVAKWSHGVGAAGALIMVYAVFAPILELHHALKQ